MVEIPTLSGVPTARRASKWINRKPAANLWHAFNFAAEIGLPLNTFVTLNFSHTDAAPEEATQLFRTIVERFSRWWRRRGRLGSLGVFAYVWVAESAGGQTAIHWVLHMPANRRAGFEACLPRWLAAEVGGATAAALDVRDAHNPSGLRRYLLKGCDPSYAAFCKINFEDQGIVHGKRSGVSRSLQRTARGRAGYRKNRTYRSRMVELQRANHAIPAAEGT